MQDFTRYNDRTRLRVYLAGPFFSDEQRSRIEYLENILDEKNFDVFSPRKASLITKDSTLDDMQRTFEQNISHIDDCDFVVAVLDLDKDIKFSDTGTVFEFGYAYSKNKPVLCFNENRKKGANLMLALSGKLPFITKTSHTRDIFNEYGFYAEDIDTPRNLLEYTLYCINRDGLEKTIKNTKTYKKEIE